MPNTNELVTLDHSYDIFPIFDRDQGYHFIIGRDILGPLFHNGLCSSLFLPDPHVKLPNFYDDYLVNIVNSLKSNRITTPCFSTPVTSTVKVNTLHVVQNCDIIDIQVDHVHVVEQELTCLQPFITNDIQTLSSAVHDLGAGIIPHNETPIRPSVHSDDNSSVTVSSESSSSSFDLHSTTPDLIKHQLSFLTLT